MDYVLTISSQREGVVPLVQLEVPLKSRDEIPRLDEGEHIWMNDEAWEVIAGPRMAFHIRICRVHYLVRKSHDQLLYGLAQAERL